MHVSRIVFGYRISCSIYKHFYFLYTHELLYDFWPHFFPFRYRLSKPSKYCAITNCCKQPCLKLALWFIEGVERTHSAASQSKPSHCLQYLEKLHGTMSPKGIKKEEDLVIFFKNKHLFIRIWTFGESILVEYESHDELYRIQHMSEA